MSYLYQPIFEYSKELFGKRITISFTSSKVYDSEKRARSCALKTWRDICTDDDILMSIDIRQLTFV